MSESNLLAKFEMGRLLTTPLAAEMLISEDVHLALTRHAEGDWGDVCDEDRQENDRSIALGLRLMSVRRDRNGTRFWIITEADRSVTTVLLPEEY